MCKVHKGVKPGDESPPFRPILSAINTLSYKIAKILVPLLADLTKNKYVSKDSFEFAKNVRNQNPDLFMASFDIDSLFTNVPIDETIDISINRLFGRKKKYNGFSRKQFKKLLGFAVKNSFYSMAHIMNRLMEWSWGLPSALHLPTYFYAIGKKIG